MVYRLSWFAGLAAILFALSRAGRLLRPSAEGLPWQAVMLAAVALGAAITWAAVAYRLKARWVALANVVALGLLLFRIAVPDTTWIVFPTASSLEALGAELSIAREIIRSGVAPVIPFAGIVAILAMVFWSLGALLTWGLLADRPYVAVLAPLVVYLEFAVMDRRPGGTWAIAFMAMIGFALLAVALDQRRSGSGLLISQRTRRSLARSLPSVGVASLALVMIVSVMASRSIADIVPRGGYLDWRASTGLSGEYYGSVSYNPFVGIRQSLVSQSNVPVFAAQVDGPIDGRSVYWRLLTLDAFDGTQWHVGRDARISPVDELDRLEPRAVAFHGPTARTQSTVTIAALLMDWLPAPYAPVALTSPNAAVERGVRVKEDDASLRFDAMTYRGLTYTVVADIPQPDLDVLALGDDGLPSRVFADASGGVEGAEAREVRRRDLPDAARFLDLPDRLAPGIAGLARSLVSGLETDFERGVALESFLRDPSVFTYSTQILPGHGADDLAAWLLEPDSPNYRTGYCEQFATAMAVMARAVGVPSRVVLGFTPGTLSEDGRIVVRDRNAHAWVELWMPSQGWVRFDPTPRGDGINPATTSTLPIDVTPYLDVPAPAVETPTSPLTGPTPFLDEPLDPFEPGTAVPEPAARDRVWSIPMPDPLVLVALVVAALAVTPPAVKWQRRRRRLRRLDDGDVTAAWAEIVDRLTDLGERPSPASTPSEIARRTTPALDVLARSYASVVYGPSMPLDNEQVAAARRSLEDTEHQLTGRYSNAQRFAARYTIRSLVPRRKY